MEDRLDLIILTSADYTVSIWKTRCLEHAKQSIGWSKRQKNPLDSERKTNGPKIKKNKNLGKRYFHLFCWHFSCNNSPKNIVFLLRLINYRWSSIKHPTLKNMHPFQTRQPIAHIVPNVFPHLLTILLNQYLFAICIQIRA